MTFNLTGITNLRFGAKLRLENGRLIFGRSANAPNVALSMPETEPPASLDLNALQTFYDMYRKYMSTPKGRKSWTDIGQYGAPAAYIDMDELLTFLDHIPDNDDNETIYAIQKARSFAGVDCILPDGDTQPLMRYVGYDSGTDAISFTMPCIAKLIYNSRHVD